MIIKEPEKKAAILFWLAAVSYMGLIFFLSSIEYPDMAGLPQGSDKVIHMVEYSILSVLLYNAFYKSGICYSAGLYSILIASFYGITDEFHQYFVPGRFASAGDIIADTAGALLGVLAIRLFFSCRERRV